MISDLPPAPASSPEQRPSMLPRDAPEEIGTPWRPLVSVVIPCHGQARYLPEAIESVLGQSYPRFEILVIDDGSPDDTGAVAARYPQVRYIRQENQGLAAARNTGLRESRGPFLVFLDADDRLLPNALASGLAAFRSHPECAFVYGGHHRIGPTGELEPEKERPWLDPDPYVSLLRGNCIGMHATVMYRREVLERVGGFDPSLPVCEDYDLYLRVASRYPVERHEEVVAHYRIHDVNMSHDHRLMLKTSLAVLARQWENARAVPRYREAYRLGVRAWQEYYGKRLLRAARGAVPEGRAPSSARASLLALVRYAPGWLAARIAARAARCARGVARAVLPRSVQIVLRRRLGVTPLPHGGIRFGDLRALEPVSREFGFDRGVPVDRYYIEGFLERNAGDVRGVVLEVGDDAYTRRFGGERVSGREVLHVRSDVPGVTVVGDLATGEGIPADAFDCVILTQTLHLIYDLRGAVGTLFRILKPGGVLLLTVPGISQIDYGEWGSSWYWSLTEQSARRLFEERFPPSAVSVETHGNVLAAVSFLEGLAQSELTREELDHLDPHYPVIVTVRAVKPEAAG